MKERILTCIVCPKGCTLNVTLDERGGVVSVSGNTCKRGVTYAEDECTHPRRTVTTTVRCSDGAVVAVKTSGTVPKERVFDVMREINGTVANDKLAVGDVIISDLLGLGVDVVATAEKR